MNDFNILTADINDTDIQRPGWAPGCNTKGDGKPINMKKEACIIATMMTLPLWVKGLALLLAL